MYGAFSIWTHGKKNELEQPFSSQYITETEPFHSRSTSIQKKQGISYNIPVESHNVASRDNEESSKAANGGLFLPFEFCVVFSFLLLFLQQRQHEQYLNSSSSSSLTTSDIHQH